MKFLLSFSFPEVLVQIRMTFVIQLNSGDNFLQTNNDYIIKSVILNNSSVNNQLSNTAEKNVNRKGS